MYGTPPQIFFGGGLCIAGWPRAAPRPVGRCRLSLREPGEPGFLLPGTRTPAVAKFSGPDGGKTAHYTL